MTVPNKQSLGIKLLARLCGQVLIHRLWINLKQKFLYTKADLFHFKSTIPLAKLDMVGSRLVPNDLIFSDDILVDIQLVILSNII